MNFFKSVFSDEPDPPSSDPGSSKTEKGRGSSSSGSDPDDPVKEQEQSPDPDSEPESEPSGAWSFGGLIRTLTVKSESVIETYRRDLQEFGTGLKKEIEVAQGSLETVGQAIDEIGTTVIKGTSQIISQGKEAILAADLDSDSSDSNNHGSSSSLQNQSYSSKRYSRFDAQVRAIQGDVSTYCEEPEDLSDYSKWKLGFVLEEKSEEMEGLFGENGAMEGVYKRVVPSSVDHETFWFRYFYKVHKLKQAEDLRVKLVNRAILTEEEELSWDVDDSDDDEEEKDGKSNLVPKESNETGKKPSADSDVVVEDAVKDVVKEEKPQVAGNDETDKVVSEGNDSLRNKELGVKDSDQVAKNDNVNDESKVGSAKAEDTGDSVANVDKSVAESKPDEKKVMDSELKSDHGRESSKGSDYSVVSSQPSLHEEEDLGWDEIEDLSNIDDDNKRTATTQSGSPRRADLRKRLSTAEEEEDLSWDIEDDDD